MITPQTIGNILYRDSKALGIQPIYVAILAKSSDEIPTGKVEAERVVIHPKSQKPGMYWEKSYNEVNIFIPRIGNRPDRIRAEQIECNAKELFKDVVGEFNGVHYKYSIDSLGTFEDEALNCEYVNIRILFEVLNVN